MERQPIKVLLEGKIPPVEIMIMEFVREIKIPIGIKERYFAITPGLNLDNLSKPIDCEIWEFNRYDKVNDIYIYRLKS